MEEVEEDAMTTAIQPGDHVEYQQGRGKAVGRVLMVCHALGHVRIRRENGTVASRRLSAVRKVQIGEGKRR